MTAYERINFEKIRGFVTVEYDSDWWLACVLNSFPDKEEVDVTFLKPCGPSPSFTYPRTVDKLLVFVEQVLTLVDPITLTGRTYSLTQDEMKKATEVLQEVVNISN